MPSFQFYSPDAGDAKWLIWGKILHRKGTRGTKYPEPNVRVQITENAIRVSRDPQTFYYSGTVAPPCQCRSLSIVVTKGTGLDTLILLSDGTQLASIPYTDDGAGTKTNYPSANSVQILNAYGFQTRIALFTETPTAVALPNFSGSPTHTLTSIYEPIIPADTCFVYRPFYEYPQNGVTTLNGHQYSGNYGVGVFLMSISGGLATYAFCFGNSYIASQVISTITISASVIPESTAEYAAAWGWLAAQTGLADMVAFGAAAAIDAVNIVTRERARLKTCSDNLKTNLRAGALQDQIRKALRTGHPISANTYQKALMTANVVNSSSGSGDDITNTKTVTLSYQSVDQDGNPVTLQQIITGTQHIVVTRCANSSGTPNAVSYTTTTYTNWLPTNANGDTGTALDYTYQLDSKNGLCQMWDGVVVTGAATIAATFDSLGGLYSPPYPQSSDNRTYSYPQLYIDYRAATARQYKVGSHSPAWLDSAFKNGETIDLFPLSVIHADLGDLGMFPQSTDVQDVSKLVLQIDMKATYKYDYKTGVWTGSGADLVDGNDVPAPISFPYQAGVNMVFRSRVTPWPDVSSKTPQVNTTYMGQGLDIKNNPGGYPLFVPLLTV